MRALLRNMLLKVAFAASLPGCPSAPEALSGPLCNGILDGAECAMGRHCVGGQCVLNTCGDGVRGRNEECDDGNDVAGDGCSPNCRLDGIAYIDLRAGSCPEITLVFVAPLQTAVGDRIDLSAEATDPDGDVVTYRWRGTGGTVAEPMAPNTTYTCKARGTQTLSIQVSDRRGCTKSEVVTVTCV